MTVDELECPAAVESLKSQGFLLVRISEELRNQLDRTFIAGGDFFRGTLDSKSVNRLPRDAGYRPFGVEYSSSPDRPDKMESFTVGSRSYEDVKILPAGSARKLGEEMCWISEALEGIAERLMTALRRWYQQGDKTDHGKGSFHQWSILQMNYARPVEVDEQYINDLHEDGCLFTVASIPSPGLEIKTGNRSFAPLTTAHDELLIMPGEILWLLSGGDIAPCYHRVRSVPYLVDRMSLLMFADIDPRLCLAWIHSEVNQQMDIGAKVLKNSARFGLEEWPTEGPP
jgi:isopenicillin N synthase-like dioxygenase